MPGGQLVWIHNPTSDPIDLGCWVLQSRTTGMKMIIEPRLSLPAGKALRLTPEAAWLGIIDQVQLIDPAGRGIDETDELTDEAFDDQIWFLDLDGEWQFGRTILSQEVIDGHLTPSKPPDC